MKVNKIQLEKFCHDAMRQVIGLKLWLILKRAWVVPLIMNFRARTALTVTNKA